MTDKTVMEGVLGIKKRVGGSALVKILFGILVVASALLIVGMMVRTASLGVAIYTFTLVIPMVFILMFILKIFADSKGDDDDE
jgi:hypothetical protein